MMVRSSFSSESANLDLIRALAVLCVFFGHLMGIRFHTLESTTWHLAQIGVLIFFVHTSFVLMLSLERSLPRAANSKDLVLNFYLRRFFRLYPLSIVCVLAAMLLHRTPEQFSPIRYWTIPELLSNLALTTNLTYTDNMVGGLWTLPLEVQMYVVLPFLFLLGRNRPKWLLIAVWLLSVPIAIVQLHTIGRLNVLGYAPCFIAGVIGWKISRLVPRSISGSWWPLAFLAVWPIFFAASHANDMYFRWVFSLALGLLIPWFSDLTFPALRRPAHYIAKYSYGIYLSHIAVMLLAFSLPGPEALRWIAFVVLAVGTPVAMYHLIEHPFIEFGQSLGHCLFERAPSPVPHSAGSARVTVPDIESASR